MNTFWTLKPLGILHCDAVNHVRIVQADCSWSQVILAVCLSTSGSHKGSSSSHVFASHAKLRSS
jgi:hypothetical protein